MHLRSLYVCYLGLDDPLVETQVVAYLAGLVERGHTIHLLTFESNRLTWRRRRHLRARLKRQGIAWHALRYHKRPSLPATTIDVLVGAVTSAYLIRRHRLDAFHARSHVPASMALLARHFAAFSLIFDMRGLMAEEFYDAGRWRRDSAPFRLTKRVERAVLQRASAIVVLTNAVRTHLFGADSEGRVSVIPCCADTAGIASQSHLRNTIRERLGLDGDRPVLIYVGKLTGWYMEREMVEFFAIAARIIDGLHFLVLTQADPQPIYTELRRMSIAADQYTVTRVRPQEVGAYLAAADVAISFVRPTFSKISSSPTKIGEYLAAGLPVVSGPGIGDVDELLATYQVGVVMPTFETADMVASAREVQGLLGHEPHSARCRKAALERLSLASVGIPAYDELYTRLARCA